MQFNYENPETKASYTYGIDQLGGLFITRDLNGEYLNFTHFYPFDKRLTYDGVIAAFHEADLSIIKETSIGGEHQVFFELGTSEDYKGPLKPELIHHYSGEYKFLVNTWGELFDLMSYFNEDVFFFEMTLLSNTGEGKFSEPYSWTNDGAPSYFRN